MRLRSLVFVLLLTLFTVPSFAGQTQDGPGSRDPGNHDSRIVRIIKHIIRILQPLDDPYISPPRP